MNSINLAYFGTITFSDATLSDINVVLCYVLLQYREGYRRDITVAVSKQDFYMGKL
jgi:hypothetical protein